MFVVERNIRGSVVGFPAGPCWVWEIRHLEDSLEGTEQLWRENHLQAHQPEISHSKRTVRIPASHDARMEGGSGFGHVPGYGQQSRQQTPVDRSGRGHRCGMDREHEHCTAHTLLFIACFLASRFFLLRGDDLLPVMVVMLVWPGDG